MNVSKKLIKIFLLLFLFFASLTVGSSETKDIANRKADNSLFDTSYWAIRYTLGNNYEDIPYFIQRTTDGGYFFGGTSFDISAGYMALAIKIDGDLNIQWQKRLDNIYDSTFESGQQTNDGGYILSGDICINSSTCAALLTKLDSSGNIIWEKYYGGIGIFNYVEQTSDNGYIAHGEIDDSYGWRDAIVVKLASDGSIQWQTSIGGTDFEDPIKVKEVSNGYILIGTTGSYGGFGEMWVVKFDTSGNVLWQKIYAGPETHNEPENGYDLIELSDGNLILIGTTLSWNDQTSVWIIKTDSSGNIIWQERIISGDESGNPSIVKTSDGNYVIGTYAYHWATTYDDIWIVKMDSNGNIIWQREYGEDTGEQTQVIKTTIDGSFILAGKRLPSTKPRYEYLIMKLKDDGTSSTACSYIGDTSVIPIVTDGRVISVNETPVSTSFNAQSINYSFININFIEDRICSTCTEPTFNGVELVSDQDICLNTGIQITWQEPSSWGLGATSGSYDIYRYEDSTCVGTSTQVANNLPANLLSYSDTTTSTNTTYYYQVVACNNCNPSLCISGATNCSTGIEDKESINPIVANNTVADDDLCNATGVIISWALPTNWGDNDYGIGSRYIDVLRDGTPIATNLPSSTTTYLDTTGTNNTTYLYQVRFTNGCSLSTTTAGYNAADMVATDPSGLTNNTAADVSHCADTGVIISWFAPGDWGDNGYGTRIFEVLRDGNVIATVGAIQWTYTDTTGTNGVYYTYTVRYINGCNLSATTSPGESAADLIPSAPSSLINNTAADANACADTGVIISWAKDPTDWGDHEEGTRTYDVLRNGTPIATALAYGTTSYNDNTGTNGVSYTYTIRYNNGCNLSNTTAGAQATDFVPTTPSGLSNNTATDIDQCEDTGVRITWAQDPSDWGDNNTGTRTYDVLRNGTPIATGISYGTTTYTDNTGTNGISYTYTVRYNNGCSLSATTSPGAPATDLAASQPSGISNNTAADVNSCSDTGVIITWTKDPTNWNDNNIGTRTYDVLRDNTPIATGLAYGTTSFTDTTGTNDTMYNYKIRYNNGCNLSATTSPGANAKDQIGQPPIVNNNNTTVDVDKCADSGVLITWDANPTNWKDNDYNPSERTYDVLRDGIPIATSLAYGTTTYIDTSGVNGQTYIYTVRYNNSCGFSNTTAGASAADLLPSEPSGLVNNTADDLDLCADTGVRIAWTQDPSNWGDNDAGIRTYDILRDGTPIATGISYATTTYTDNTGTNGISYTYTVRYNNGCSLSATTSPGAQATDIIGTNPMNLNNNTAADADPCLSSGIIISWEADPNNNPNNWGDNDLGTRTYDILRNGTPIATGISYPNTSYLDTTAVPDSTYTYTVRYNNGCSLSSTTSPGAQSADLSDTIPCNDIGNRLFVSKSGSNVNISWSLYTGCADLANYNVYASIAYSTPFPSNWTTIGTPTSTSFTDPISSSYIAYKVLAKDLCGNLSND